MANHRLGNHRLGKADEARTILSEIPELREELKSISNHVLLPLLDEVEKVLGVAEESNGSSQRRPSPAAETSDPPANGRVK